MPRLSVCLAVLVYTCVSLTLISAEESNSQANTEAKYFSPGEITWPTGNGVYDDEIQALGGDGEGHVKRVADRENTSSGTSLWEKILNRIGKTQETFGTSGQYPHLPGKTAYEGRYLAPQSGLAKLKRNLSGMPSFEKERAMNDGKFNTEKKRGLSINGALSSLADMLSAEGQRRDHAAALRLRQRLLVAGKR
ncbi:uncharacterized protein [Haliotis asinina]|uniref:uncharacterized protein n=1 Tax=Haliotis asinina TaxID=109174 RepID=UPI003531D4E2